MGCDIHCYIEHRSGGGSWEGFGGRINPGRKQIIPVSQPKCLPEDADYQANGDNRFYISDMSGDGNISATKAKNWVAKCWSKYEGNHNSWVTNPDWHSHSWLTPDEFEKCLKSYSKETPYHYDVGYATILDCLRSFERQGHEARLVFWFDN